MADHDIRRVTGHSTTGMLDYYQGKDNASVKNLTKILTNDRSKKESIISCKVKRQTMNTIENEDKDFSLVDNNDYSNTKRCRFYRME